MVRKKIWSFRGEKNRLVIGDGEDRVTEANYEVKACKRAQIVQRVAVIQRNGCKKKLWCKKKQSGYLSVGR